MDAAYANTPGTDEFIPAWAKGPDGGPTVIAIQGFDWNIVGHLPITTDFVLDPYDTAGHQSFNR
jgi:hypothetical protein